MFSSITRVSRRACTLFAVLTMVVSTVVIAAASSAGAATCTDEACLLVNSDAYAATANHALTVSAPGLLSNDLTPAGTTVDIANSDATTAFGAALDLHADGSFTYTPDPDEPATGLDSFTYSAKDPDDNTDFNTVYVRVDPVPHDDTYYTKVNTTLSADVDHGVFVNDIGLEQSVLGYDGVTAHGQVVMNDDGSFDYTPNTNFSGMDSFKYTAFNLDDTNFFSATVKIFVDSTAPTAATTQPSSVVTLDTKVPVAWSASDLSGIAHYDVRARGATWKSGFGGYSSVKTATTSTSTTFNGTTGATYCFSTRAVDNAGNLGGYGAQKCSAVPLRANGLTYSSGFKSASSSAYYGGIAYGATALGQTMTRTGIQAKKIYLVVSTCPTCGTLQVKWGNTVVANVSLVSSTSKHKVVVGVASFASVQTGTLTATVTSNGKGVVIEGLAAYRDA